MINATLCSTNGQEPWAANVEFEVKGVKWIVSLNTKYAHYRNIVANENVVLVYKTPAFEIIAKGKASLSNTNLDHTATATITLTWLRLVENDTLSDYIGINDIERVLSSRI